MLILYGILIFWAGLIVGFLLLWWRMQRHNDGVIHVEYDELQEKVVYSLVLDDYPEKLEFKKVVIFKVDHSEEEVDRN